MAHAKLTSAEVHVCPLKRHDFAYSETCVTSEQRDEMRLPADRTRRFNQPFVIIEVVEACFRSADPQQFDGARKPVNDSPFDSLLQQHAEHRQDVVDGLRRLVRQPVFQALNVLIAERVQPTRP